MSDESATLGTSTVSDSWRICLLAAVREAFDDEITIGDRVVFEEEDGRIVIAPAG